MLNLNPNYVYFGYDINLDETGLRLDKFDGGLVRCDNERYYSFQLKDSEYPEDMEARISELRNFNDFHSLNEFDIISGFNVETNSLVQFIRLKRLARNYKLLEMVYNDKAVDDVGMNVVLSYIHYVNLKSGKEYVECMGKRPHADAYVSDLRNRGFVAIENSHLLQKLEELPDVKGIRVPIKTKSQLERK